MDKNLVSMRALITRVNSRDKKLDRSTFSKASKNREAEVFKEILNRGLKKLKNQKGLAKDKIYFPLDSTVITLTSKLLWGQGYHQVKLFAGLNSFTSGIGGVRISFGQDHDSKEGIKTIENIPKNGVGVMDRGFYSKSRIRELLSLKNKYIVLRVKNDMKLEM
ncbi:MAG: transposase [Cyanobacteria bacterium P01_A01_bin.40]